MDLASIYFEKDHSLKFKWLALTSVKKDFTMPFTFQGNVFKSSFDINRLDFNVNTAEPAHGAASVKVDISVPVTKA